MPNALSLVGNQVRAVKGERTLSPEYQLVSGILANYPEAYTEFTYTGSNLTGISIWASLAKVTLLVTKTFSYSGGNLVSKVVTDEITLKTITVTYGYTGSNLTSKATTFSSLVYINFDFSNRNSSLTFGLLGNL
jgi:hypothetical protein